MPWELIGTISFNLFKWIVETRLKKKLTEKELIDYMNKHEIRTGRAAEAAQETNDRIAEMDRGEGT